MDAMQGTARRQPEHRQRWTALGVPVMVWTGTGVPDDAAFVYAHQVPALAGCPAVRLGRLTRHISASLALWCADRMLAVARVDDVLVFPAPAATAWARSGIGRTVLTRIPTGAVVPFPGRGGW